MLVLGIETSGLEGSIALLRDQTSLGELRLDQPGRRHAQSLVLEIGELLQSHGVACRDIDLVAVSRGPGSFTGLRVGMVCAKTFAYATNCRFVAIDTFAAIAENAPIDIKQLYVIEDAQRDDLFVGEYRRNNSDDWERSSTIRIVSTADFLRDRTESDIITGPGLKKLDSINISKNWLADVVFCKPRASIIAKLGYRIVVSERDDTSSNDTDFWKASPFYLRLSAAEEKRAIIDGRIATQQTPETR